MQSARREGNDFDAKTFPTSDSLSLLPSPPLSANGMIDSLIADTISQLVKLSYLESRHNIGISLTLTGLSRCSRYIQRDATVTRSEMFIAASTLILPVSCSDLSSSSPGA